ncbi:MAG: choice-of-anchor J domain-containing protein, partial [Crocinitomicaceae bacterium]
NDSQGNSDDLIMNFNPSVIAANSYLKFDVAYARWGSGYSDTLEVLASTDCGQTYQSLYMKGGTDLATSPDFQDYFTPNSSQWRTDSVDLAGYSAESNLQIAFRNIGRYGNVLYLDNINIGNLAILNEIEISSLHVYPNPIKNGTCLTWNSSINESVTLRIFDPKGKQIFVKQVDGNQLVIPENMKSGNYLIQFQYANTIYNRPLIIID